MPVRTRGDFSKDLRSEESKLKKVSTIRPLKNPSRQGRVVMAGRNLNMSDSLQQSVKKYHAFYEVSPYNIVVEEGNGSPNASRHMIQAGFDVDVHGVSNNSELELGPPADYAFGYAELKKNCQNPVSHHASESSIEVIPSLQPCSPMHVDITSQKQRSESESHTMAVLVSVPACRNNTWFEEVEKQLASLGVRRR